MKRMLFIIIVLLSSCNLFDNRQEKKYMTDFISGREKKINKDLVTSEKGIYLRKAETNQTGDSLYYAYTFNNGKVSHFEHINSTRCGIDSLINHIKSIENQNLQYLMNSGVYYVEGDTLFLRNYYRDTHSFSIKNLIIDSKLVLNNDTLRVVHRSRINMRSKLDFANDIYILYRY
jgi:hypothetical protein